MVIQDLKGIVLKRNKVEMLETCTASQRFKNFKDITPLDKVKYHRDAQL
jgi:hypothetical protein